MNSRSFINSLLTATALLLFGAVLIPYLAKKPLPKIVWGLIPLYGILSFWLYKMIVAASIKSPTRFVTSVYTSALIKLMLSMTIVAVYFIVELPGKKALAIAVMGIYTVYTVTLIKSLLPVLRKNP